MLTFLNLQENGLKLKIWCILIGIIYKILWGGNGIFMVPGLLGGGTFSTPLPACLCLVLSSGPARPFRILHKAEMFSWKYQFVLIYHLLSPWGQEIVIHCSLFHPCFHLQIESNELEWWNSNIWMIAIFYTYLTDQVDELGHREYMEMKRVINKSEVFLTTFR